MGGYRISMDVLTKGDGRKWIKKSICQKKREGKAIGTHEKNTIVCHDYQRKCRKYDANCRKDIYLRNFIKIDTYTQPK